MLPSLPRPSWAVGAEPVPLRSRTTRVMPLPGLPRRMRDTVQPVPPLPAVTNSDRVPGAAPLAGYAALVGCTLCVGRLAGLGAAAWLVAGWVSAVGDLCVFCVEYRIPAVRRITTRAAPSPTLICISGDDSSLVRAPAGLGRAHSSASR